MKTRALMLAAALGGAVVSSPAMAEASPRMAIKYSDLDLSTESGQAQLARRIDGAARAICGLGEVRTGTILGSSEARRCYKRAKATASEQVAQHVARDSQRGG